MASRPDPDSLDGVEIVDDDNDLQAWADAQIADGILDLTIDYLNHCLTLDHGKHHHR
jgi:hypothetical protein